MTRLKPLFLPQACFLAQALRLRKNFPPIRFEIAFVLQNGFLYICTRKSTALSIKIFMQRILTTFLGLLLACMSFGQIGYSQSLATLSAYKRLGVATPVFYAGEKAATRFEARLGARLSPYRSAAVNPNKILLGSVLFVSQLYGAQLPSGEIHDGLLFAQEAWRSAGDSIALFVGEEPQNDNAFVQHPAFRRARSNLEIYLVHEPHAGAFRRRFRETFEPKPQRALHEMLAKDIDVLLRETSAKEQDFLKRLQLYSARAKGTPYSLFCLGEGPNGKYDRDPLIDFSRADCVTFIEQMLALALSTNYEHMFATLQRIRYANGVIGYTTRNHYTHADWVPNNSWLLEDVTAQIGNELCVDMTKTIDRPGFFRKLGVAEEELQNVRAPQTMTIKYIPTANLPKIKSKLQGGEIVSIIQKMPGIFSAHTGFIFRDEFGNVLFRHASSRKETQQVTDEFFDDVIEQLRASETRVGMAFIRIKSNPQ